MHTAISTIVKDIPPRQCTHVVIAQIIEQHLPLDTKRATHVLYYRMVGNFRGIQILLISCAL